MNKWGPKSRACLDTCDKRLVTVFNKVLEIYDCSVLEGARTRDRQEQLFKEGRTKVHWPDSKHNRSPSNAADVVPYPVPDWENDREKFVVFAGFVIGVGHGLSIPLRWGGDWDCDWDLLDQRFNDWPHFELVL